MTSAATLSVRVLGPIGAELDGHAIDLGAPLQRAVLARLLLARGAVVSVDRLLDDLWHGQPPPRATASLQTYVSNLRRAVEPGRSPRTVSRIIISTPPGYAIPRTAISSDAWEFEDTTRSIDSLHDVGARADRLALALSLWRGTAFGEFAAEPWATAEVARLDELASFAREQWIDALILTGANPQAVVEAEALTRATPLREEPWRLLALAQYRGGRQSEALATLRAARATFAAELGVDPSPAINDLEHAILTHSVPAHADRAPSPPQDAPTLTPSDGLIGRRAELAVLRKCAAATTDDGPAIALIAGEPGAGKSALLATFAAELSARGWRVAIGRCPESPGGTAAWACAELLRGIAAEADPGPFAEPLAPLLTDSIGSNTDESEHGRFVMHRAAARWLSRLTDRPLALIVDDAHHADGETRLMLASLAERVIGTRMMVVLAHRTERTEILDDLLADLAHLHPARVMLSGLDASEAAQLVATIAGAVPSDAVLSTMLRRTDGNPFYLAESARLLASEGELVAAAQVPAGVVDVVRRRVARLPDATVTALRVASVLGRTVDPAVLERVAGLDELSLIDALEGAQLAGLIEDDRPGLLRFAHLLVREALYTTITGVRRRAWHQAAADAVAELYPTDLAALAHHSAAAAVPATAVRAASHCLAAAAQAELRYGYDIAVAHLRRAVECLDVAAGDADERLRIETLQRLVPTLVRAGDTTAALAVRGELVRRVDLLGEPARTASAIASANVASAWSNRPYGYLDTEFLDVIDRTLRSDQLDDRLRCLVLNTRVRETTDTASPRPVTEANDALALAEAVNEPDLIALSLVGKAETYPADLYIAERDVVTRRLRELTSAHELPLYELIAAVEQARSAIVHLDFDDFRDRLDLAKCMAAKLQLEQAMTGTDELEAAFAHVRGDLDEAERIYREVLGRHDEAGGVGAQAALMFAIITLRCDEGRIAETLDILEPVVAAAPNGVPGRYAGALALAYLEQGRRDDAIAAVARMPELPPDYLWPIWTAYYALAVAALDDAERSSEAYQQLAPYSGRLAGGASGYVVCPVDQILSELARPSGDPSGQRRHRERARDVAERCHNARWLAQAGRGVSG